MLHPVHKVPQSPSSSNTATASRIQPVHQTPNNGMQ